MGAILGAGIVGGGAGVAFGVAIGVVAGVNVDMLLGSYLQAETAPRDRVRAQAAGNATCLRQDERTISNAWRPSPPGKSSPRRPGGASRPRARIRNGRRSAPPWKRRRHPAPATGALPRQAVEIALVRWQNTLEPLTGDWDRLTHEECSRRLQAWPPRASAAKAFCASGSARGDRDAGGRVRPAPGRGARHRRAPAPGPGGAAGRPGRQGIAPLDEALQPVLTPPPRCGRLDVFNARAAIGEFSSAFGDLEAEYARLQSEHEMAEQVR